MKIIETTNGNVIDITNIDFLRNIANVQEYEHRYSVPTQKVLPIQVNEELKLLIDDIVVEYLLNLPEYSNYAKLSNFKNWQEENCPQRAFFNYEQITDLIENNKDLVDDMFEEPKNPFKTFAGGRLIYFWSILSEDVQILLQNKGIELENK